MLDGRITRSGTASTEDAIWEALDGWRAASACRDLPSDAFFFDGPTRPLEELAAKAICAGCIVVDACLAEAIAHNVPYGVWGGMTAAERRPLRRAWMNSLAS